MIELTDGRHPASTAQQRPRAASRRALRREIGYVIQQIGLFPHQTVAENIATVPELLGWDRRRIAARVDELLELVGLDPAEHARPLPGAALRRPAPARRRRPRARRRPAADADGRAVRRDRPDQPRAPAERVPAPPGRDSRKTIVFVTHDIDEAIKMGDRIAVLRKGGGVLAQYATPAELLIEPADEFVEDFVGADRALKRLSLLRVARPRPVAGAARARRRADRRGAGARPPTSDVPYPLLIDADGRPLGWLSERDLRRERVRAAPDYAAGADRSTATPSCATRSPTCCPPGRSTGRSSTPRGAVVGRAVGRRSSRDLARRAATRARIDPVERTRRDRRRPPS